MKTKNLWITALVLAGLCALTWWQQYQTKQQIWQMGVESGQIDFRAPESPVLFLRPGSMLGETKSSVNLAIGEVGVKNKFLNSSYTKLQSGLFLVELGDDLVFLFTKKIEVDPTLQITFESDWVVLTKSSLLPQNWPVPEFGWVVLNTGTLSKNLKGLSLQHQKPIVRPVNNGTLFLQKELGQEWVVKVPE